MKKRFKFSELAFRVPCILIGLYVCVFWGVKGELKHLLIFWVGAWFWESVLFIAARYGLIDFYWNNKSEES